MSPSDSERAWIALAQFWSRALAAAAGLIAVIEVWVWMFRPAWIPAASSLYFMKANAALVLLLLSAATLLTVGAGPGWRRRSASVLAVLALLITVPTLLEYVTSWSPGLDALFGPDPTTDSGRMAAQSAGVLSLLAIALLMYERDSGPGTWAADGTLIAAALILEVMVTGYFDHARLLYDVTGNTSPAPQSGLAQMLLCAALAFGRVGRGAFDVFARQSMGSTAMRALVPAIVLLPVVLGRLRVLAESLGWLDEAYAHAIFSVAQTAILGVAVFAFARHVNRLDARYRLERKRREEIERYVAVCAWTRRIRMEGRWVSIEDFLQQRFGLKVTHGISDEALAEELATLDLTDELRREAAGERE